MITFRLSDSLPRAVIERWRLELAHASETSESLALYRRIENYLDQGYGAAYLKNARVASLVQNAMLHLDGQQYKLSAWVVMPNHVHLLFIPGAGQTLSKIMHSLKSYTANQANKLLHRKGEFWMKEYFDRFIRDARHFAAARRYIEHNPVKARLCQAPHQWPYSSAFYRHTS